MPKARPRRGDRRRHHRMAGRTDQVARDLEVHRLRAGEATAQHPRDLRRRAVDIVQARAVAGDLRVDLVLGVERPGLVVQEQPAAGLAGTGTGGYHDHGRLLGEGRSGRIDHVQRPRPVGDGSHREPAAIARRRIRGEPHPRLVGQGVQGQDPTLLDHTKERQREITGDAEDLARAVVAQRMQEGLREVHGSASVVTSVRQRL